MKISISEQAEALGGSIEPRFRLAVSASLGAVSGLMCFARMTSLHGATLAGDFTWHWLAVRALLHGQNPYEVVAKGGPYDLVAPYIYPLTTTIVAFPFAAWMPPIQAASVFIAVSTALLAWGVTKEGYQRLPLFVSLPFFWAAWAGQWSILVMATMLIPTLGWLAPVKPSVGLPAVAYRPAKVVLIGSAVLCAAAFILNPLWLFEWHALLGDEYVRIYKMPVAVLGGPLLLLSVFRWRRPEARMLFVFSLMPQLFLFYDQLLLWLIPKSWKGSLLLAVLSWVALPIGNWRAEHIDEPVTAAYAPVVMALLFLPSLVMVMRRPNEGFLPARVESFLAWGNSGAGKPAAPRRVSE